MGLATEILLCLMLASTTVVNAVYYQILVRTGSNGTLVYCLGRDVYDQQNRLVIEVGTNYVFDGMSGDSLLDFSKLKAAVDDPRSEIYIRRRHGSVNPQWQNSNLENLETKISGKGASFILNKALVTILQSQQQAVVAGLKAELLSMDTPSYCHQYWIAIVDPRNRENVVATPVKYYSLDATRPVTPENFQLLGISLIKTANQDSVIEILVKMPPAEWMIFAPAMFLMLFPKENDPSALKQALNSCNIMRRLTCDNLSIDDAAGLVQFEAYMRPTTVNLDILLENSELNETKKLNAKAWINEYRRALEVFKINIPSDSPKTTSLELDNCAAYVNKQKIFREDISLELNGDNNLFRKEWPLWEHVSTMAEKYLLRNRNMEMIYTYELSPTKDLPA